VSRTVGRSIGKQYQGFKGSRVKGQGSRVRILPHLSKRENCDKENFLSLALYEILDLAEMAYHGQPL
jgi:hypothetical protein